VTRQTWVPAWEDAKTLAPWVSLFNWTDERSEDGGILNSIAQLPWLQYHRRQVLRMVKFTFVVSIIDCNIDMY
jgi:hypothetical protein